MPEQDVRTSQTIDTNSAASSGNPTKANAVVRDKSGEPDWLQAVCDGEFSALPEPLQWADTAHFAHVIDGYRLSRELGLGELRYWANRRASLASQGTWEGTAVELWMCLFYEHRRYRHMGEGDPTGWALDHVNALCRQLRDRLASLEPAEKETLLRLVSREQTPPGER